MNFSAALFKTYIFFCSSSHFLNYTRIELIRAKGASDGQTGYKENFDFFCRGGNRNQLQSVAGI